MFRRLSTRLTVVYAGLFGAALFAVAMIVYVVISDNAARAVRNELAANGEVFDRVWTMRDAQLRDSADILSRDFGFREAVATLDAPTIGSALDNLRDRLQIDRTFMMTLAGDVVGGDGFGAGELDAIWSALDGDAQASGVLILEGRAYQAVSAPVRAPNLVGWIVFASELNAAHLDSFERLSAIPLNASVFTPRGGGGWASTDAQLGAGDRERIGAELSRFRARIEGAPQRWRLVEGPVVAVTRPLRAFGGEAASVLVLTYPLALALRPYQPVLASIVIVGLLGMGLLVFGSWVLARGLTRPIAALDDAVHALQRGERVHVAIQTSDEIGRLALSFNSMSNEIDERQRRITHMALHDSETGLPNRRSLEAALDVGGATYVAAFAIQRLATIRDAVGYALMVELVRGFGDKLRQAAGEGAYGRLSGDSLAILIDAADAQAALDWAERVRAELEGPVRLGGVSVDLSLVAGVASAGDSGDHAPLDQALVAVTQAVATGKKCAYFDASLYGDPAQNLSLMSDMISGIERGELELHYQPKFDLRAGSIAGVEALVRWNHPVRGRIAPDLFVTMAEDTGNIEALTQWTLMEAMEHQRVMRERGHDLPVSVNLSGMLIGDDAFTSLVISLVESHGATLCLEITETAAMSDGDAALRNIDRYIAAGVQISIDDYGAGLSSLSYLKRIRAHELKLDKSFVRALDVNSREALLVRSTVDLAHGLGMKITAEGVETGTTLALLTGMGCDLAQGYFIDRPMPLADLLSRLSAVPTPNVSAAVWTAAAPAVSA
jgi:diguanylate cyclase